MEAAACIKLTSFLLDLSQESIHSPVLFSLKVFSVGLSHRYLFTSLNVLGIHTHRQGLAAKLLFIILTGICSLFIYLMGILALEPGSEEKSYRVTVQNLWNLVGCGRKVLGWVRKNAVCKWQACGCSSGVGYSPCMCEILGLMPLIANNNQSITYFPFAEYKNRELRSEMATHS